MKIAHGTIAVLAIGISAAFGVGGCNTGRTGDDSSVYFGPGSAPNQGALGTGPAAGGFTLTTDLNFARANHTATLLSDGRVLVVGGIDPNGPLDESEVFDPNATPPTWTLVSALPSNAALQPNANPGGFLVDPTLQFATVRFEHSATVFLGGTVLITGGAGVQQVVGGQPVVESLDTAYRFEPTTNQFELITSRMPVPRFFHLSQVMVNGDVLVVGGYGVFNGPNNSALLSADAFNSVTGWTSVGTGAGSAVLAAGHTHGNIHQIQGDTLVINGLFADTIPQNPQQPPPGITVRSIQTGVFMPGGSVNGNFPGTSGETFDPTIGQTTFNPGPQSTREQFPSGIMLGGSVTVSTGDVFFAGGENLTGTRDQKNAGALATTELLDAATRTMTAGPLLGSSLPPLGPPAPPGTPAPPTPFTETECAEVGFTSDVMIIGGLDRGGVPTTQAEQWNYLNNFMVGVTNMVEPRSAHKLIKLDGNRILVIGGLDDQQPPVPKATCEIWSR